MYKIKIETNTTYWQNYQFPEIPGLKVEILTKKVGKSINFKFLQKQNYFEI